MLTLLSSVANSEETSQGDADSEGGWFKDVSHTQPKSAFVKMGPTLVTAVPVDLGWEQTTAPVIGKNGEDCEGAGSYCKIAKPVPYCETEGDGSRCRAYLSVSASETNPPAEAWVTYEDLAPNIGSAASDPNMVLDDDGEKIPVLLNSFLGAAQAHCLSLSVENYEHEYPFRVCDNMQLQALSAVHTMPHNRYIMTGALGENDRHTLTMVESKVDPDYGWVNTGPQMYGAQQHQTPMRKLLW